MRNFARLATVLAVQLVILVLVPARQVLARLRGTTVTLRTAPVDPFDVLAGHYVTLTYEVEAETAGRLPEVSEGETVWINVARAEPAWTFVSVTRAPAAATPGQVSIRARREGSRARIEDASRFYVTAERGAALDARGRRGGDLVDLRVDGGGTPAVVRLRSDGLDLPAE